MARLGRFGTHLPRPGTTSDIELGTPLAGHSNPGPVTRVRSTPATAFRAPLASNPPALLGRTPADEQPSSPERRCPMARLRTMLVTLAVASLLLVATATTALAGITATAVD